MKPLNISVVGAGYWGRKVIRETLALSRTSGQISLHSVVDNSPTVLEQCRKEFGSLYYLRFRWTGYLPPQKERDVITDLGPHPLDICNHVLDVWPRKISCRGRGFRVGMSDEVAFINTEHANGLHANIELSWLDHEKRRDVMVVGSEGMAHLDCLDQKLSLH